MGFLLQAVKDEAEWFVPDIADNRSRGESEQFRVKILPLSGRDKAALQRAHLGRGGKVNLLAQAAKAVRAIVERVVVDVQGLSFQAADGSVKEVRNASDLYEALEQGPAEAMAVIDQIVEFAEGIGSLGEADSKN